MSREEKKRKEREGPRDKARAARAVRWREEKAGEEALGACPCAGAVAAAWRARVQALARAPLGEEDAGEWGPASQWEWGRVARVSWFG